MKLILLTLTVLFSLSSTAQNREKLKEKTFDPASFPVFTIELKKKKKEEPLPVRFKKLSFLDFRADTSKIGFVLAGANNDYHRLIFPKGAVQYLEEKLPSLYTSNSDSNINLTCAIKHLWVSERLLNAELGRSMLVGSIEYFTFCYLNMDYYAEINGEYTLLGTLDTVISARRWIVNYGDDLIKETFWEVMNKANRLLKKRKKSISALSKQELINKYKMAMDYPVLASAYPAKGVYLSYQEFLNNSPSITNFDVEKTKRSETLKSKEVPDSVINKAWAYSDGNSLNIHINNNYYRAVRVQNTFELAGPRDSISLYGTGDLIFNAAIAYFAPQITAMNLLAAGAHNSIMKELVPFQLNIREGTLY